MGYEFSERKNSVLRKVMNTTPEVSAPTLISTFLYMFGGKTQFQGVQAKGKTYRDLL